MRLAFHEFAKGQERLAKDIVDAWRSLLLEIEACSPSRYNSIVTYILIVLHS